MRTGGGSYNTLVFGTGLNYSVQCWCQQFRKDVDNDVGIVQRTAKRIIRGLESMPCCERHWEPNLLILRIDDLIPLHECLHKE